MIEKRDENLMLMAAILAAVCLIVDLVLLNVSDLKTLVALVPYPALCTVLCLFVWLRARLHRQAEQEKQDATLARRETPEANNLFEKDEEFAPFSQGRTHAQFEKFVVPAIAPLFALIQGIWVWWLYELPHGLVPDTTNALMVATLLTGQSFLLFLFSRYQLGLARGADPRYLNGTGVFMGVTCFATILVAVGLMLGIKVAPQAFSIVEWILIGFLALLAIESLLGFIGELYRPRRDAAPVYSYESRLGGLLTDPGAWVNSVAQALDYQFGFNISQTWFYRFLQGALMPLLLFQVAVLYLLSSFVFIGPEEEGILERFGEPRTDAWQLESGLHVKWPWPFETVRRFPTKRIQRINIGYVPEDGPRAQVDAHEHQEAFLWGGHAHAEESLFVAAAPADAAADAEANATVPVSFLNVHIPIEFTITNVFDFAYNFADPHQVLEEIAYRTFTLEAARRDIFQIMAVGHRETTEAIRSQIQVQADALHLGVGVFYAGLQGVHPPAPAVESFESVIGSREEKEAIILRARTHAGQVIPMAKAESKALLEAAKAYRVRRSALSEAEVYMFQQQQAAYASAPSVFRTRRFLRVLEDGLKETRKYIVPASAAHEVIELDLVEKITPDLFDLGPASPEGKTP